MKMGGLTRFTTGGGALKTPANERQEVKGSGAGDSNFLCGIPFGEAKRGLQVEFVCCRLHIDVE
jgi:hypothetical protein